MNFRPELADAVLAGRKDETRRPVSDNPKSHWWKGECFYKPGKDYAICPGRAKSAWGRAVVLETRQERLGDITHAGAVAEGSSSVGHFSNIWIALHDEWDPDLRVWVVRLQRIKPRYAVMVGRNSLTFEQFATNDLGRCGELREKAKAECGGSVSVFDRQTCRSVKREEWT